jgi:hypothetical protein
VQLPYLNLQVYTHADRGRMRPLCGRASARGK